MTFAPDPEIFEELVYDYDTLAKEAKGAELSQQGTYLRLTDEREKNEETGEFKSATFHSEGGLNEFVKFIDQSRSSLIDEPIHVIGKGRKCRG